ncbi:MAG: hypothetical protein EPO08_20685 [Rhodospirillaceae bacterium]|nr:MAG: hypothetical protein EPO08_20685 [Rhodospirillaceae bacterium]
MANVKYASQNTFLYIGDGGGSEMFFKVLGLEDITLPQTKATLLDVTTQDETDHYMDYLSTLLDNGEATFPVVLDPNEVTQNEASTIVGTRAGGLKYLMDQRVRRNMRIEFGYTSPVTRMRFVGIVTEFSGSAPVKGALRAQVRIKAVGKNTLEVGTGAGA